MEEPHKLIKGAYETNTWQNMDNLNSIKQKPKYKFNNYHSRLMSDLRTLGNFPLHGGMKLMEHFFGASFNLRLDHLDNRLNDDMNNLSTIDNANKDSYTDHDMLLSRHC